jgi:hypothetical protein
VLHNEKKSNLRRLLLRNSFSVARNFVVELILSSKPGPPGSPPPVVQPVDQNFIRKRLQLLAWIRVGLGAASGAISGIFGFTGTNPPNVDPNTYYGIYIAIFVYIASYYLAKYPMGLGIMQKDRTKMVTQGIGSFIMVFLFTWILYNTLLFIFG